MRKTGFIWINVVGLLLSASLVLAGGQRGARDFNLAITEDATRDGRISVKIKAKRAFSVGETKRQNKEYQTVPFESCLPTKQKGFPEASYFRMVFQLRNNQNYKLVVQKRVFNEKPYDGEWLPSRGQILRNQNPSKVPYHMTGAAKVDADYPQSDFVVLGDPFLIREVRGIGVTIYPVLINTVQKRVKILRSIEFELVPVDEGIAVNQQSKRIPKIFSQNEPVLNALFDNFRWEGELDDGPGHMLVIYTSDYESAIQPFIAHKESLGFTVTEREVAKGTDVDEKNIIQDAYDGDHDLLYVQLVGDWEDIQCETDASGYPQDNALGLVSGTDPYYDLIISRFSAENPTDVTTQVNKVIAYEANLNPSWWTRGLGIASNQGPGDDNEDDYEHLDIIKANKLLPNGYTAVYGQYDPTGATSEIALAIDSGVHVINYVGHGCMTGWSSPTTQDEDFKTGFYSEDVNALANGDKLPFIFSVACNVGEYQSGTCFAERWLRKSGGGAVSALMSTISQPWDPPMRGQDYMNDLLTGGYDYSDKPNEYGVNTDHGKTRLGSIVFNAFNLQIAEAYAKGFNDGDVETTQTWVLFGDGSLLVSTVPPCPDCSGEPVENITFLANSTCTCTRTTPMTLGEGIVIESGASVTFQAPVVNVLPGFNFTPSGGSNMTIRKTQ